MNLLTRARFGLARMLYKAASFQIVSPWVRSSWLQPAFSTLVADGYRKNAVVFACVSSLAFDIPKPPVRVYADDGDDAPVLETHPLRRLLRRPNPIMGERELWAYTATYAGIGGNAYWHIGRNSRGAPIQLWPYHAEQITVRPGGETWVKGYTFHEADGTEVEIPTEDIVHFKWPSPDPQQPWQAQPPLLAAAQEVDADNEATRYLRSLLKNDAIPRTIITQAPERFMTDEEVQRAKAQFRASYGGDNAGGVLILEAGAGVERLGLNLQELAFDALHKVPEQRISGVLRVPLSVAGIGEDPIYANAETAYERYVRSTLASLWALWGDEVQNSLADQLGVHVRHDISRIPELQEDENAKWARVTSGWGAGLLGFRESRALLGITGEPEQGDLFVVPMTRELLPYGQITAPPPAPAPIDVTPAPAQLPAPSDQEPAGDAPEMPEEDEPVVNVRSRGMKGRETKSMRTARALQRARERVARAMERRVEAFFDDLAATVARRAESSGKAREAKALPEVEQLILPDDAAGLAGIFRLFTLEVVGASWELWNQALDVELAFDESDPAVVAALAQSGARITGIVETTRTAVRELLEYGAEQGWTLDQLVRGDGDQPGLRDMVAQTYRGRARNIARTETALAQTSAAVNRFRSTGVSRVLVLDGGGEDSDDACNQLNGTVQTLEWAEANPIGHPSCVRCFAPSFD